MSHYIIVFLLHTWIFEEKTFQKKNSSISMSPLTITLKSKSKKKGIKLSKFKKGSKFEVG